jgi:hypothetical protein
MERKVLRTVLARSHTKKCPQSLPETTYSLLGPQ